MNIDEIELRRLDLTVLLVFVNLLRFRKATDVADHMGLTQSSISHSIKRLRDAFGDPLFLRTPKGMEPTAVALAIEPQIRTVIETLSEAMQKPFTFDPTIATDVIKIGAYDLEMTTLVPALLETIRTQAPNMRVSILPLGRRPAMEALEDQSIDIALGFAWDLPSKIHKVALFEERYCVVMRKGHPRMRARHMPFAIGPAARDQWLMCMDRALEEEVSDPMLRDQLAGAFRRIASHMQNRERD